MFYRRTFVGWRMVCRKKAPITCFGFFSLPSTGPHLPSPCLLANSAAVLLLPSPLTPRMVICFFDECCILGKHAAAQSEADGIAVTSRRSGELLSRRSVEPGEREDRQRKVVALCVGAIVTSHSGLRLGREGGGRLWPVLPKVLFWGLGLPSSQNFFGRCLSPDPCDWFVLFFL